MPRILPSAVHLRQTLRLTGACALAYAVAERAGLPEKYWALITAVVVTQPMLSDTLTAGRDRIAGTLLGAATGFLVLELVLHGVPVAPLLWSALVVLSFFIALYPYLRLSAVTLIIVVLVPGTGAAYERPFDRVIEILLGTISAIVVAALLRPRQRKAVEEAVHSTE